MTIKDIKKKITEVTCISNQEKYYQAEINLYLGFIEYLTITDKEKLINEIDKIQKIASLLYDDKWKEI
jgi:hypothetical protein